MEVNSAGDFQAVGDSADPVLIEGKKLIGI